MEIQQFLFICYLAVSAFVITVAVNAVLNGDLRNEVGVREGVIISTLWLASSTVMSLVWPILFYFALRSIDEDI